MRLVIGIALLTLLAATAARADTLLVEGLDQARATAAERPSRGMTMASVATRWGEPDTKAAAVGAPPITRWDYPGFSVFFEYEHVVHAVVTH